MSGSPHEQEDVLVGIFDPGGPSASSAAAVSRPSADGRGELGTLRLGPLVIGRSGPGSVHRDESLVCVVHGTVFDTPSLSRDAERGAEVSLASLIAERFRHRGPALMEELRGAFLLVVWDAQRCRGLLAQDQLTARPLFVSSSGPRITFASEIGPLLGALPARPGADADGVVRWISSRALPDGLTMYAGVRRLGLGQSIALDARGWRNIRTWWPRYRPPLDVDRGEAMTRIRQGVQRAVENRVEHDGRLAILLSGGFDSGILAGFATRALARDGVTLPAYSSIFPGEAYDESPGVETLTRELGLPSVRLRPRAQGALSLAVRFQQRWGVPQPGPGSLLDQFLLRHAAADGALVAFDGQGGDELFGYSPYLLADLLRGGRLLAARRLLRRYPGVRRRPSVDQARALLLHWGLYGALPPVAHRARSMLAPARELTVDLLTPASRRRHHAHEDPWRWKQDFDGPRWWSYHASALTTERETAGMYDYLRRRARIEGVESRSPLLVDVELVELILSLPPELAYDPRVDRGLARASMRGIVPEPVRMPVAKSNYAGFIHTVLAGAEMGALRRLLGRSDAEIGAFVDLRAVRRQLLDHPPELGTPGWGEWGHAIWSMATGELWLRAQALGSRFEGFVGDLALPAAGADPQ